MSPQQVDNLRLLLQQESFWVRRARWQRWLEHGVETDTWPITSMTAGERTAANSWLHQQRHAMHAVLEGGPIAPEGWVESLPLAKALG